jgi:cell envelope opacity-associated protein A
LSRQASPLLHDYKPSAARKPAKSKAIQWFAVGLGIPLLGIALVTGLSTNDPKPAPSETPAMVAADTAVLTIEELDAADITRDVIEPEIAAAPEPEFDILALTVGRGDTMEKLFRRNSLDIGHLMAIAQLDEAKQRFRRIKPGDVFEVTHDAGKIVSLYSKLDLTSALQIERQEEGFAAQIVERPPEFLPGT